jgi:hypothetical protein
MTDTQVWIVVTILRLVIDLITLGVASNVSRCL